MKIKKIFLIVSLSCFSLIFFQFCTSNEESGIDRSTGKTSELLVIAKKGIWESNIGDTISKFFGQNQVGLPQNEPIFNIVCLPPKALSNKMFKRHHNIFIVDINKNVIKPYIENKKDYWAEPQRIIKINVPNNTSFFKIFDKNKETFLYLFHKTDIIRTRKTLSSFEDVMIRKKLIKDFKLSLKIPGGSYIAKETKDFMWIRREPQKYSQGLLIYFYNYTDTNSFNTNRIIAIRDSITKKYIPGPTNGSYMITSRSIPFVSKRINFKNHFAIETRGLWEVANDFMGGPFLNYTLVDEDRNRVVTIDGYVYDPNESKRDLLLEIESMIYTLEFEKK